MIPIDNRFEAAALWVLESDSVAAHESPHGYVLKAVASAANATDR